jgi:transcriptional regulator with XRE-family HTH domain
MLESGAKRNPSFAVLQRLARALGVPVHELVEKGGRAKVNLQGKYLAVWITDAMAKEFLGLPRRREAGDWWVAVGKVVGEWPIGVWLEVVSWTQPDGGIITSEKGLIYLVRWEWIHTARLLPEKPKEAVPVGFRLAEPSGQTGRYKVQR